MDSYLRSPFKRTGFFVPGGDLGFTYEGLFRQHTIVKDRNRDTTWFSMLDTEWSQMKENMEEWLYHNPDRFLVAEKKESRVD